MFKSETIICSEMDIDLKDKSIMENIENKNIITPIQCEFDPTTLITNKNLIENLLINITNAAINMPSLSNSNIDQLYKNSVACIGYEDLGNHWMLANNKTVESIKDGNKDNFIFVKSENDYIVLVNIKKDLYDDGSYKRVYSPLTIKRMPE